MLIVVLRLPEVGLQRRFEHLCPIYHPTGKGTRFVNRDGVVLGADDDGVRRLFHLRSLPVVNPHVFEPLR